MKIIIKATNAKLTPEAHEFINKKITSLARYYQNIIEARIDLGVTTLHHQKGNIYRAEINLRVPKKILRAVAETNDIIKAVNQARHKLKLELIKYKEINLAS